MQYTYYIGPSCYALRLTTQTDFALRTLMYLAANGRVTAGQVAELFGISVHHVAKVGGGIELARPPAAITIGEIIVAFEGTVHLLDCIGMDNVCVIERFCKLKGVLAEAERIQREYLSTVTLDEVVPARQQLELLSAAP